MARTTWVIDRETGEFVEKHLSSQYKARVAQAEKAFHYWPDLKEYASPIDGRPIAGRAARKWDLERSGSIEPDTGFRPKGVRNPRYASDRNPLIGRDCDEWSKPRR